MAQEIFRGAQQRRLQQLLNELNQYLQALGLPQRTLRNTDTEQRLFQEINSAKYQWSRNLPWYQKIGAGTLWKPRPPGETPAPPAPPPPPPPPPPDTTGGVDLGTVDVETIQGRQFIVRRNAQGRIIDMEELSQAARGYSEEDIRSMLRGQAMAGGYYDTESQRQQMYATAYDQVRREILATLNEPADWIKRWQLQNAPNPYIQKPLDPGQTVMALQDALTTAKERQDAVIKRLKDPNDPLTIGDIAKPATYDAQYAAELLSAPDEIKQRSDDIQSLMWESRAANLPTGSLEQQMAGIALTSVSGLQEKLAEANKFLAEYKAIHEWQEEVTTEEGKKVMVTRSDYPEPEVRPTTPPAPAWLSQFAPGQVTGRPITKEQIPTPSGQLLTRTPWSQLQGVAGFAEWSGGRPWRDILGHAELMQPRTPIEAGRTRWRPARQYV